MLNFRKFFNKSEEEKDIESTLNKLPKHHRSLVDGYTYKFHNGNTLDGDSNHVGYMDPQKKEIAMAGSWKYPKEWIFLHEIAHRVWDNLVGEEKRKEWEEIVKDTKNKQNQSADELFCHAYAANYSSHKIKIHHHPKWIEFIKNI